MIVVLKISPLVPGLRGQETEHANASLARKGLRSWAIYYGVDVSSEDFVWRQGTGSAGKIQDKVEGEGVIAIAEYTISLKED